MNRKFFKNVVSILIAFIFLFFGINLLLYTVKTVDTDIDLIPKIKYYFKSELDCLTETKSSVKFKESLETNKQIEITYELNYSPYEDERINRIDINSTHDQVDAYLEDYNVDAKNYYTALNELFLQNAGIKKDSEYYNVIVSEYSPYIQVVCEDISAYIDNEDILVNNLSVDKSLASISVGTSVEMETQATRSSDVSPYEMNRILSDIGINSQNYTGKKIKVGILEARGVAYSSSHTELNNVNISVNGEGEIKVDLHAVNVTRLLCGSSGVAPDIDAAYIYYAPYDNSFIPAMNWFLDNGCRLVNASLGLEKFAGEYFWVSSFIDYMARFNHVTFVNSAGNSGNLSNHYVTSPATGFNVITVGNTNYAFEVLNSSSYGSDSSYKQLKPTLSAPGTGIVIGGQYIGSGTSYSAPIVTGVIARLMQQRPELRSSPETVGAILIVSATPAANQSDGWDNVAGAGIVNYARAQSAINNTASLYSKSSWAGDVRLSFRFSAGKVKVAAFWLANSKTNGNATTVLANVHTNYDLILQDNFYHNLRTSETLNNIEYIVYNNSYERFLCALLKQIEAKQTSDIDFGAVAWCSA